MIFCGASEDYSLSIDIRYEGSLPAFAIVDEADMDISSDIPRVPVPTRSIVSLLGRRRNKRRP
jgi:hypothetical protein